MTETPPVSFQCFTAFWGGLSGNATEFGRTQKLQRGTRKDLWPKYSPKCPVARHFVCSNRKQVACHS
jgi:hypothetical protein